MKILYGTENHYIDVTERAKEMCTIGNTIIIPRTDEERGKLFGDPIFGQVKHILIVDYTHEENKKEIVQKYEQSIIRLNL